MRKLAIALMIGTLSLGMQTAYAATAQQTKMKTCNADASAKALKGDDRKAFMKTCLSAASTAAAAVVTPQQEKMKACNTEAGSKSLKGTARKSFMKECLSNKAAAPAT